jgi:hypothetical protein
MTFVPSFDFQISVFSRLDPADVEFAVSMPSGNGLEDIADLVDCLCSMSQIGSFARSFNEVRQSSAIWSSEGNVTGDCWKRRASLKRLDPVFWRILVQMFVQCHFHLAPFKRVLIQEANALNDSLPIDQFLGADYAKRFSPLPFRLIDSRVEGEKDDFLAVRVQTAQPLTEKTTALFKKTFEDWGSVLYVGGFSPATDSMTSLPLERVQVSQLHSKLLEGAVRAWDGPEEAIDWLINVCCGLHAFGAPIEELEIE